MLRYAWTIALLLQSNLPSALATNISCAGIEYAKVCCNGYIIGPPPVLTKLNNIDGLTCCQGDVVGRGIATACTSGTPIPMFQLASAQANDTIVSAFVKETDLTPTATPTPTSTQSTATSTSSKGAGAGVTAAPWDAALLVAGVAAALI